MTSMNAPSVFRTNVYVSVCLECVCEWDEKIESQKWKRERRSCTQRGCWFPTFQPVSLSESYTLYVLIMWSCSRCPALNTNWSLSPCSTFRTNTVYADVLSLLIAWVGRVCLQLFSTYFCLGPPTPYGNVFHPVTILGDSLTLLRTRPAFVFTPFCCAKAS